LHDPDWFLDRIDPAAGTATFVRTDVERLSAAVFLDGRTPFSSGEPRKLALDGLTAPEADPLRLILHMSFCGSSQLAHLVGSSGAAIALKEPHALVDLADWQRSLVERGIDDPRFPPALGAATELLSRTWPGRGPTVLKPSNWVNNLMPDLIGHGAVRAVLVTIDRRAFLRAVFRGGRDRLAFTARVATHFAAAANQSKRVGGALAGVTNPLDQIARLTLLAHHFQQRWFEAANSTTIDHRQVRDDPHAALTIALAALDLSASPEEIAAAVAGRKAVDAKQPERGFSVAGQAEEDEAVERHHADRFDRALDWADAQRL
jgi:hypothetical protein